jgi:hypothetical protein
LLLEVSNDTEADVTLVFEATRVRVHSSNTLPVMRVVAPHGKLHLTTPTPERGARWHDESHFLYMVGSAFARHAARNLYALPYARSAAGDVVLARAPDPRGPRRLRR